MTAAGTSDFKRLSVLRVSPEGRHYGEPQPQQLDAEEDPLVQAAGSVLVPGRMPEEQERGRPRDGQGEQPGRDLAPGRVRPQADGRDDRSDGDAGEGDEREYQ